MHVNGNAGEQTDEDKDQIHLNASVQMCFNEKL